MKTLIAVAITLLVMPLAVAQCPPCPECPPPPVPAPVATWAPGMSWNYQIGAAIATSVKVQVIDVDGFDNPASDVDLAHAAGMKVICYIDAGTYENWRPDANQFLASALGANNGWPGERWLDIRQPEVLAIMAARFLMCKQKGFDAIEPDNIDGYSNSTGFPLTSDDQLTYNRDLAKTAHALGISIALKNDVDQAAQLVDYFDFAINEQCWQYSECSTLKPFIDAGKAVFNVEYRLASAPTVCPKAKAAQFSTIFKKQSLGVTPYTACQ